jgi:hypothetical protein
MLRLTVAALRIKSGSRLELFCLLTVRETSPRIHSFGHLSMPVRDVEQSKRFFIEVMGSETDGNERSETFTEVRLAGPVVGFSTRGGMPTGRDVEYPHYAFYADAENFLKIIE